MTLKYGKDPFETAREVLSIWKLLGYEMCNLNWSPSDGESGSISCIMYNHYLQEYVPITMTCDELYSRWSVSN